MSPMIMFNQVNKWYGAYQALTDLSAEINTGEVVVVCGPSGSGKSTLIRTVNRLEPIDNGQIVFNGIDIHGSSTRLNHLRTRIGFVFQSFNLFPHVSVAENIMMSPMKVLGVKRAEARQQAGSCWSGWGYPIKRMPTRHSSPAASSNAWRLPVRWR
jgi:amino acid ABC transporter ATP-binding protein, PAAT family (TC 3.A.1.3.-)